MKKDLFRESVILGNQANRSFTIVQDDTGNTTLSVVADGCFALFTGV